MSYQQLAPYYDELMSHVPYEKWVEFTVEQCAKHHVGGKRLLELGCGTGEIAVRLAKAGYDVTGVDLSEEMLTVGMEKAMTNKIPVQFVKQNIVELEGFAHLDVIVSYLDVMNYITNAHDLERVFEHVYESLSPNGLFIFDVHDDQFVETDRIGQTFVEHTDNVTYIWECDSDQQGRMTHYLTFFIRQPDGSYEKFTETHQQHVLAREYYEQLLKKVGFTKIQLFADITAENDILVEQNARNFILAQK